MTKIIPNNSNSDGRVLPANPVTSSIVYPGRMITWSDIENSTAIGTHPTALEMDLEEAELWTGRLTHSGDDVDYTYMINLGDLSGDLSSYITSDGRISALIEIENGGSSAFRVGIGVWDGAETASPYAEFGRQGRYFNSCRLYCRGVNYTTKSYISFTQSNAVNITPPGAIISVDFAPDGSRARSMSAVTLGPNDDSFSDVIDPTNENLDFLARLAEDYPFTLTARSTVAARVTANSPNLMMNLSGDCNPSKTTRFRVQLIRNSL